MVKQHPLTLVTPVLADMKDELFTYLKNLKARLEEGMLKESLASIGTIHFARWLVIDYEAEKGFSSMGDMPKLVFSSNFDGDVKQHIYDLCTKGANVIDSVYECCEGYPAEQDRTPERRIEYLNKWFVPASAFYCGAPKRDLKQILDEDNLRNFIRNFLDSKKWDNYSATQVQKEIQAAVLAKPEFEWVKEPFSMPHIHWGGMILLGLTLIVLSPIIILWILWVQFRYERHDEYFTLKRSQLDDEKMWRLEEYEDWENQNQFSQLCVLKPGKVRLITFKAFMLFARVLIPVRFTNGKLMGIPTIHFARWVLFDKQKRVLFFSNFDGSWQQYLGDFIDQSGWGLTGIFSNTTNFPKTRFLLFGGAYDEEHFLAWSRSTEMQTQIWYSAYPHLSIKNVNNNSFIRSRLMRNLSEKKATQFLNAI